MNNQNLKIMKQAIKEKNARQIVSLFNSVTTAEIEQRDEQTGMNLIHYAVSENAVKELYVILAQYRTANLDLKTYGLQKKTALEMACDKGNVEIVKLLLENGANIEDLKELQKKYKSDSVLGVIEKSLGIEKKKSFFSFFGS